MKRSESYMEWAERVNREHEENMRRLDQATVRYRKFNDGLAARLAAATGERPR